jgi:hypothetical protein
LIARFTLRGCKCLLELFAALLLRHFSFGLCGDAGMSKCREWEGGGGGDAAKKTKLQVSAIRRETCLLQVPHEVPEQFLGPFASLFAQLNNWRLALLGRPSSK